MPVLNLLQYFGKMILSLIMKVSSESASAHVWLIVFDQGWRVEIGTWVSRKGSGQEIIS
jgi:hypothetical protein